MTPHTLRYFSLLFILGGFHALYHKFYDFAVLLIIHGMISYNYWRNPVKGLRRNIDICSTLITIGYITSFNYSSLLYMFPLVLLSSHERHQNKNNKKADEIWMILHIIVFVNVNFTIWKRKYCSQKI